MYIRLSTLLKNKYKRWDLVPLTYFLPSPEEQGDCSPEELAGYWSLGSWPFYSRSSREEPSSVGWTDSFLTKLRSTHISTSISLATCLLPNLLTYSSAPVLPNYSLGLHHSRACCSFHGRFPLASIGSLCAGSFWVLLLLLLPPLWMVDAW